MSARGYVRLVLALVAAFLVPAAALNLALSANSFRFDKNRLASEWQQAARGVTYAPPISQNRPFKTLRLIDRAGEIDTLVFGSSTTMGIDAKAFPPPLAAYNFAQSGNSLLAMIGEAEHVAERPGGRVKLFVIPLDWALGFVYERGAPPAIELTREAVERDVAAARPSLAVLLTDALSAPRLKVLAGIVLDALKAPDTVAVLRQVFIEPAGPEYRCADGTPARDFDVVYRGMCNGFRYDGSATFADQKRLDEARAPAALAAAVSGGGQYAAALRKGRGEPAAVVLERLARLTRRVESGGGAVVLLLPPLMPGMEAALAGTEHSGAWLRMTKQALESWSAREGIALFDAGRSERYGCVAAEFIDPHHALPGCYHKVFSRLFQEHPGLIAAAAGKSR
jgi:hypothetical protein